MIAEPIEAGYFNWLCAQVMDEEHLEYIPLLEVLFNTEFIWVIQADQHRAADGFELRQTYLKELGGEYSNLPSNGPTSVLEVLISFSQRAEFQTDHPASSWFWIFVSNLSLDQFKRLVETDRKVVDEILYNFIWRIYEPDGTGGLFPMHKTKKDQRDIELWYQFCEYLEDQGLF